MAKGKPLDLVMPEDTFGVMASTIGDPELKWVVALRGDEPFIAYQQMGSPARFFLTERGAKSLARRIFTKAQELFQANQKPSLEANDFHE